MLRAITINGANDAPVIGGVTALTQTLDTSNVAPFSAFLINDVDTTNVTVSITLDSATKGTLSTSSGFASSGNGVYTVTGMAAAAQDAMHGLIFNPTDNQAPLGGISTTTFTISVNDESLTTTDSTTTVESARATGTTGNDTVLLPFTVKIGTVDLLAGTDKLTLSSAGNNVLTVNNVATITGGSANDIITLGIPQRSGNLNLAGGDDTLIVTLPSSSFGWGTLNGGTNSNNDMSVSENHGDTFAFDGSLDLTLVPNFGSGSMSGIETLSMQDVFGGTGNDFLKLNSGDIIALGTGTFDPAGSLALKHAVRVDGDSGDTVNLTGGGWTSPALVGTNVPAGYDLYVHNTLGQEDAYALVQHVINVIFL